MATIPGEDFHEFINLYAKNIATAGVTMGMGDIYKRILIPHRGNGKTSMQFPSMVRSKPNIRGTIKRYSRPEVMIWDDMDFLSYTVGLPPKPKSLALLDAEDILFRDCMEDDCTWKQGQVAKWCNKYPKKGRKR